MIAAAIPYILQGASLLGGLIGKKKKVIDPEYMRQHFGTGAIADNAQKMANAILSSSYGNQLMSSAAADAQRFQGDMNARVANAGLDPSTGGESGASTFATSAAGQAQGSMERLARKGVYEEALPVAQQQIAQQRADYLTQMEQQNAQPSMWQRIGEAAGGAASMFPTAGGSSAGTPGQVGVSPSLAGVIQRSVAANPSMVTTDASPAIMGNVRKIKRRGFSPSSFVPQVAPQPWQG